MLALSWRLFCSLVINVAPATVTATAIGHLPSTAPRPAMPMPMPLPTWFHLHPPLAATRRRRR
uniref:Secreted protein n=1 Tax=Oryza brachyantha TaxID=4533 RepID=J3MEQ9_ORYBR